MPIAFSGNGLITTANATFSNAIVMTNNSLLATANAGFIEYNGTSMYFTPAGTQRGVVPGMQMFVLSTDYVGLNSSSAQTLLGLSSGVTLSSNTAYAFEIVAPLSKSSGTTAHTVGLLFAGTATISRIGYYNFNTSSSSSTLTTNIGMNMLYSTSTASTVFTGSGMATNPAVVEIRVTGTVTVNVGGTFLPQYICSSAPGGSYTTANGAYMIIYPIGTGTANVSIGTWA